MRYETSPPLRFSTIRGDVCVAEGYGLRIHLRHGRLHVCDGFPGERRERVYGRVNPGICRLVVLGHAGSITFEALRWLTDLGIAFVQIDKDGRLVATSAPRTEDVRLRRAQALAGHSQVGVEIARAILSDKLAGQRRVLQRLRLEGELFEAFTAAEEALKNAATINELVQAERDAALAYWAAWAPIAIRFRRPDLSKLPDHWHRFGRRGSPLTAAPRLAVNPINALLNYLYAILEAETRIACLTLGLDPSLGIVHADFRSRDSFALDVMETVRADVDTYVLELLSERTFTASDFYETPRGNCRLLTPMTQQLAQTAPTWARLVAPVIEQAARMLAATPGARMDRLASPLTNANRHAGRDQMRKHPRTRPQPRAPKVDRHCQRCGGEVPHRRRVYCDDCLPHFQREQLERATDTPSPVEVVRTRTGRDATHGGDAAVKRGASIAARKRETAEWEQRHGKLIELSAFEREILPLIHKVPLSALVRATGLSLRYCSQIRRGEKVPHPRHWEAFVRAAGPSV
jgi:CRISPR-associated endonuclease Cas1